MILEGAIRVEVEEELTSLGIDQEGRITRLQPHESRANTVTPRPSTMEMTTTQMTTRTNCLFCMGLIAHRWKATVDRWIGSYASSGYGT